MAERADTARILIDIKKANKDHFQIVKKLINAMNEQYRSSGDSLQGITFEVEGDLPEEGKQKILKEYIQEHREISSPPSIVLVTEEMTDEEVEMALMERYLQNGLSAEKAEKRAAEYWKKAKNYIRSMKEKTGEMRGLYGRKS